MTNLTKAFRARKDAYAKRQGDLVLGQDAILIGDSAEVWHWFRSLESRLVRVIYECKDGTRRDIIGRQGVHNSAQDGTVQNIGHAMANAERLTLSFWTHTHGTKVNIGTGAGYRTLRATGILAVKVDGHVILTDQGLRALGQEQPVSI